MESMPRPKPDQTIAARLRRARELNDYETASEAADQMDVPVSTYLAHENGTSGFALETAGRYARFFGVRIEWLLFGKEPMKRVGGSTLQNRFEQLDPDKQKEVLQFFDFIENRR